MIFFDYNIGSFVGGQDFIQTALLIDVPSMMWLVHENGEAFEV